MQTSKGPTGLTAERQYNMKKPMDIDIQTKQEVVCVRVRVCTRALSTFSLAILEVRVDGRDGEVNCHGQKSSGSGQSYQISCLASLPLILHFFRILKIFSLILLCSVRLVVLLLNTEAAEVEGRQETENAREMRADFRAYN